MATVAAGARSRICAFAASCPRYGAAIKDIKSGANSTRGLRFITRSLTRARITE